MTKQEYIKKESEKKESEIFVGYGFVDKQIFAEGLSKGLEIAEGFAEWVANRASRLNDGTWEYHEAVGRYVYITTAELLNIYLTENEKNNVDKNS